MTGEIPEILPGGIHLWPIPQDRPALGFPRVLEKGSVLPKSHLEELASEYRVKEVPMGHGIRLPGGAIVMGNLEPGRLKIVAGYFSEAIDMLIRALGSRFQDDTSRYELRIYQDQGFFRTRAAQLGAANAESLYDPRSGAIEMPWPFEAPEDWLARTLFHEATHAWMHHAYGLTSPLWLAEGMAEYFSSFVFQGAAFPGAVYRPVLWRLPEVPIPLERFMAMGRDDFYGIDFQPKYAQAWSVIAYLMDHDPKAVGQLMRSTFPRVDLDGYLAFYRELLELARSS